MAEHEPDCPGPIDEYELQFEICSAWCEAHHRCEPIRESDYQTCGECLHVFRTPEELVESDLMVRQEIHRRYELLNGGAPPERREPEEIGVCPHCAHDF